MFRYVLLTAVVIVYTADAEEVLTSKREEAKLKTTRSGKPSVVLSNGSDNIKAGLSTDEKPVFIPNLVGRPRNQGVMVGMMGYSTYYYGFEVIAKRGVLSVEHPTKDGKVAMWDLEGGMWRYVLAAVLDVEPSEASVLAVTPVDASEEYIERTMATLRSVGVQDIVTESEALLVLRSIHKDTGLVVLSGAEVTVAAAVVNGVVIPESIFTRAAAGYSVTEQFMRLSAYRMTGPELLNSTFSDKLKIEHCYVALDYEEEFGKDPGSLLVTLVGFEGQPIGQVDVERFLAAEGIFQQDFNENHLPGLQEIVYSSWQAAPSSSQDALLQNVVLAGGNTLLKGFPERLQKELGLLVGRDVMVHAPSNRWYAEWNGGKMMMQNA